MIGNNSPNLRLAGWIALAALNCALVMPWLSSACRPPFDFAAFYAAAQLYQHNPGHLLYDLRLQLDTQQRMFPAGDGVGPRQFLPFNHLPYELVLWLPLTKLPFHLAFWLWRVENIGLLVLTSWLFVQTIDVRRDVKTVMLICLAFFPVPWCLLMGQDTLVILTLYAVCLWCLKRERQFLAGAALGLCLFKFQLVLPIIGIMLLRRSWRVVAGFASSATMGLAVSTAMVGYDGMRSLFRVWLQGESGTIVCINPLRMPNIRGLLAMIPGLRPGSPALPIATAILSVFLLFLAARQAKTAHMPEYILAISVCFVVLVSFHANVYDLAILILPILLLLGVDIRSRQLQWTLIPPLLLLFFTPLYVVVLALSKGGPLAILAAWSWYGISYWMKCREAGSLKALANPPELATVLSLTT